MTWFPVFERTILKAWVKDAHTGISINNDIVQDRSLFQYYSEFECKIKAICYVTMYSIVYSSMMTQFQVEVCFKRW